MWCLCFEEPVGPYHIYLYSPTDYSTGSAQGLHKAWAGSAHVYTYCWGCKLLLDGVYMNEILYTRLSMYTVYLHHSLYHHHFRCHYHHCHGCRHHSYRHHRHHHHHHCMCQTEPFLFYKLWKDCYPIAR